MTKSSMTSANTSTALAKIAGISIGNSTRRTAPMGVAPRSMAACSYCLPMVISRARTITTG